MPSHLTVILLCALLICIEPASSIAAPFKSLPCSLRGKSEFSLKIQRLKDTSDKSSVLILPGLNLNPHKMDYVETLILQSGLIPATVALQGHRMDIASDQRLENFKSVKFSDWEKEVICAHIYLKDVLGFKKVHVLGYSLGGLLASSLLNQGTITFESAVLLAPAISVYPAFYLSRIASIFPRITYPSMAPKSSRANSRTPISAYNAIYRLLKKLNPINKNKLNIPTTVIMATQDELIDNEGITEMIKRSNLTNWSSVEVEPLKTRESPRHLMIRQSDYASDKLQPFIQALQSHYLTNP